MPVSEKLNQVLAKDYGEILVMTGDRLDSQFYESIDGGLLSKDRKKLYFVGIIDTLTYYGTAKKVEYYSKNLVFGKTVSCIPPK